jgi:hypothetical protein
MHFPLETKGYPGHISLFLKIDILDVFQMKRPGASLPGALPSPWKGSFPMKA